MRMKNAFKYIVGIFFTCYGAYFGFHSVYVLKKLFNVYSYIIKAQYGIGNSMFLLNLFLNSIMSIFELTHSITCLMIGMSRKRWKICFNMRYSWKHSLSVFNFRCCILL